MKRPRAMLADTHPLVLELLRDLLKEGPVEVVGTVTDGRALVEEAQRLEPDVIITDISMPLLNGLDATRVLRATVPRSKVIILAGYHEPAYVTLAFHMGASGYLLKPSAAAELQQAILHVLAGDGYVGVGVRVCSWCSTSFRNLGASSSSRK